jgi:hypothetical protein
MSKWPYRTYGEQFADFLLTRHIDSASSAHQIPLSLIATGRGAEWAEALNEMAVLHLARRLISAAASIVGRASEWDYLVESEIKQVILDTMTVDYFVVNEIYARLQPAVRAARQSIAPGLKTQLEAAALRMTPWCYLCGTDLDFKLDGPTAFSLDHVWPRAYGGNSDPENLLAACKSCNEKKADVPSWALYPVQALVAGYQLDAKHLAELPKELRFAAHAREAAERARHRQVSLKSAFCSLGRPDLPQVTDFSTSVDVFNLSPQYR